MCGQNIEGFYSVPAEDFKISKIQVFNLIVEEKKKSLEPTLKSIQRVSLSFF